MKKIFFTLFIFSSLFSNAQIICIFCYNQNDSISDNVNNLLVNGGFETGCNNFGNFCPNSNFYNCNISNWTCSGGGPSTYAMVYDTTTHVCETPEGKNIAYFGNGVFTRVCSVQPFDTSCMADSACIALNVQPGFPYTDSAYGGSSGVKLEQTVSGLTIGSTYILEFWAGGEGQSAGWIKRGLFAVDLGFGDIFLRCYPTNPGYIGTRFIIEFNAVATSHTIKFTSWGHICGTCTELMLDNVRLYTLAELDPGVPPCAGASLLALFTAPNHICPGTCTDFTNLSTNATGYLWSFPGATPGTSTDMSPSNICYSTPGNYNVQLIATNATSSDTLLLPNYITVYPTPPPQGIAQNGDTLFAITGATSYQWYFNGNLIAGATNYFYIAPTGGNYNVVATDANGCEVEAVIFDVVAAMLEVSALKLEVFPNPVDEQLQINNLKTGTAVDISIYNMLGETVYSAANYPLKTIDCAQLPSGIYYLEVTENSKTSRSRFVKSAYRQSGQ